VVPQAPAGGPAEEAAAQAAGRSGGVRRRRVRARALPGREAAAERKAIVAEARALHGPHGEYVERTDLRIEIFRFCKELLRDEARTVGRLDSRYTGFDRDSRARSSSSTRRWCRSSAPIRGHERLRAPRPQFEADLPYEVIKALYVTWGWNDFSNRYASVGETLRKAMSMNPRCACWSRAATSTSPRRTSPPTTRRPPRAAPELRKNITRELLRGGHMMYVHKPSLEKLAGS
jgi:carboxypeptidase C (cathepsin A)